MSLPMSFQERFSARLKEHLTRLLEPHGDTYSYLSDYILEGGKQVRPLMFLEALESWGYALDEDALDIACALELLHTFFLIHDDVMDDDDMRRDKPTLHAYFLAQGKQDGVGKAVIWGDMLYTEVISLLAGLEIPRLTVALMKLFTDVAMATAHGQLLEANREQLPELAALLQFYEKKTALYSIYLPLQAAALVAEKTIDAEQIALLSSHLGLAYQVYDDLVEVQGDKKRRANRCGDVMRLKATPLLLRVIQDLSPDVRKTILEKYHAGRDVTEEEEQMVLAAMQLGTIEETRSLIVSHAQEAHALLEQLGLQNSVILSHLVSTYRSV